MNYSETNWYDKKILIKESDKNGIETDTFFKQYKYDTNKLYKTIYDKYKKQLKMHS